MAELEPVDILASPEFDESRVSYSVAPLWTPAEPLAKCWVLQAPTSMPPPAGELLLLPKFARLVKLLYLKGQAVRHTVAFNQRKVEIQNAPTTVLFITSLLL